MKIPAITIMAACLSFAGTESASNHIRARKNEPAVIAKYNKLNEIVIAHGDEQLVSLISFMKVRFEENKWQFLSWPDSSRRDMGNCMGTMEPEPAKGIALPTIQYEPYYLELGEKRPSLPLSILIHELRHLHDYFKNPANYKIGHTGNPIEKYLYEMDAVVIEANFISTVLSKLDYDLTKYEKYLKACWDSQSIASLSFILFITDYVTLKKLDGIKRNANTHAQALQAFYAIGRELAANFPKPDSAKQWNSYCALMPAYTFQYYGKQAFFDINLTFGKTKNEPFSFNPEIYPEYKQRMKAINELLAPHLAFIDSFHKDFIRKSKKDL